MSHIASKLPVKELKMSAIVVRCGCDQEIKDNPDKFPGWHGHHNCACPNPISVEDKGVIAYKGNLFNTIKWKISKLFRR